MYNHNIRILAHVLSFLIVSFIIFTPLLPFFQNIASFSILLLIFSSSLLSVVSCIISIEINKIIRSKVDHIVAYQPKRIVVFMPNWIGDAIMATSFLKALREMYDDFEISDIKIDIVVKKDFLSLFEGHKKHTINDIITFNRDLDDSFGVRENSFDKFRESLKLVLKLRENKYDFAVLLTNNQRNGLISIFAKIPRRFGYSFLSQRFFLTDHIAPPYVIRGHDMNVSMADYYSGLAYYLGYGTTTGKRPPQPKIYLSQNSEEIRFAFLKKLGINFSDPYYICVAPGASKKEKRWNPINFAKLAIQLRKSGFNMPILFTFGPGESKLREAIKDFLIQGDSIDNGYHLIDHRDITLSLFASILKKAIFVISNDTAPIHLSRITGSSSLAICGPTNPLYHRYKSKGNYKLVFPSSSAAQNPFFHRHKIADIAFSKVERWSIELINRAILTKHMDTLLNNMFRGKIDATMKQINKINQKIRFCQVFIKGAIKELEKNVSNSEENNVDDLYRLCLMNMIINDYDKCGKIFDQINSEYNKNDVNYVSSFKLFLLGRNHENNITDIAEHTLRNIKLSDRYDSPVISAKEDLELEAFLNKLYNSVKAA